MIIYLAGQMQNLIVWLISGLDILKDVKFMTLIMQYCLLTQIKSCTTPQKLDSLVGIIKQYGYD